MRPLFISSVKIYLCHTVYIFIFKKYIKLTKLPAGTATVGHLVFDQTVSNLFLFPEAEIGQPEELLSLATDLSPRSVTFYQVKKRNMLFKVRFGALQLHLSGLALWFNAFIHTAEPNSPTIDGGHIAFIPTDFDYFQTKTPLVRVPGRYTRLTRVSRAI